MFTQKSEPVESIEQLEVVARIILKFEAVVSEYCRPDRLTSAGEVATVYDELVSTLRNWKMDSNRIAMLLWLMLHVTYGQGYNHGIDAAIASMQGNLVIPQFPIDRLRELNEFLLGGTQDFSVAHPNA